jgi:peptidyl-prolyl cis-trans isomerase C
VSLCGGILAEEPPLMRRLFLAATVVALIHAVPALAQGTDDNPVVATVDGAEIRRDEVEALHLALPEQYRQMPLEMIYDPLLQRAIDTRLLAALAERQELEKEPEVQTALARARAAVLRDSMIQQRLSEQIDDAALQAAYDEAKARPGFAYDEVHARHILLESEADARAVIAELGQGADFAELAKSRSKDPSAQQNAGDLGYFRKEAMVPEFADAAFALEKGAISKDPVKSHFGWHVIWVEDRRTTEPSLADMEGELREELSRQIVTALLEEARQDAKVERFNLDGSPQAQ